MNKTKLFLFFFALFFSILACEEDIPDPTARPIPTTDPLAPPRSFYLGFTPFPYDATTDAVLFIYERLVIDGDIIAHHFDDGVPWPEALSGEPYSERLQGDWEFRKQNTPSEHKVYLAITPIRLMRDGLARPMKD